MNTETFYRPLNETLAAIRNKAENEGIPIISQSTEVFLLSILNIKKPKHILEIGTAVGYSAACFAEKAKDCNVISIESDERMYKRAVQNLAELNLPERVTVIPGDAETVIAELSPGNKFDFVFIDAAKSRYRQYFDAALKVCCGNAVIISDNVFLNGTVFEDEKNVEKRNRTSLRRMKEYLDYILSLDNADTSIITTGDGIALTVLTNNND